jgi:hypothetical protein
MTQPWTPAQRFMFRFGFIYSLFYIMPFPLVGGFVDAYERFWGIIVAWVGEHILRLERPVVYVFTGSGDTTFHYVQLLCFFVLAVLGAVLWPFFDTSQHYQKLYAWLRCYVRYFLAFVMLGYGIAKVFVLQFPMPAPELLTMSYADSSPMGVLWRFMGVSPGYTIFGGALEVLGGMLLFWRRTTMLGALVVGAVMTNIVALNFFYDVPVKLFSSHLLLMALFLLLPDMRRLFHFFVMHHSLDTLVLDVPFSRSWMNHSRLVLKSLFISFAIVLNIVVVLGWRSISQDRPESAALYEVEVFVRDGVAQPPLLTDALRWRWVSTWRKGLFYIRSMDDSTKYFLMEQDTKARTLTLTDPQVPKKPIIFSYEEPDQEHLILEGQFRGAWLRVRLKKVDMAASPLLSRGFHWINERPYYR